MYLHTLSCDGALMEGHPYRELSNVLGNVNAPVVLSWRHIFVVVVDRSMWFPNSTPHDPKNSAEAVRNKTKTNPLNLAQHAAAETPRCCIKCITKTRLDALVVQFTSSLPLPWIGAAGPFLLATKKTPNAEFLGGTVVDTSSIVVRC